MKVGIIGLPNVGKSTVFNALTGCNQITSNYPYATTESISGYAQLNDDRLDFLANLYNPRKTTKANFEFVDMAGLVAGSTSGAGLGNEFLNNIRNSDCLMQVLRLFDDENILHVNNVVDPISDLETVLIEIYAADISVIDKRMIKINKKAQASVKEALVEATILNKVKEALTNFISPLTIGLTDLELSLIKSFNLLSLKPMGIILNVDEDSLAKPTNNNYFSNTVNYLDEHHIPYVIMCASVEADIASLEKDEMMSYLELYDLKTTGSERAMRLAMKLLDKSTFFTVGNDECRAWLFTNNTEAKSAAGLIHSDIMRGFIKAEVISYQDFFTAGDEKKAKELNKYRLEGKNYLVKDGDIINFRFNV